MPKKLTVGGDIRTDWRTTNLVIDQQDAHGRQLSTLTMQRRQVFGGGGGRMQRMRVTAKVGDVLFCKTILDGVEGTDLIPVAVNEDSRQLASEVLNGVTHTYTDYTDLGDGLNFSRNSNNGDTDKTEVVTPFWKDDGTIQVVSTTESGVQYNDDIDPEFEGEPYDIKLIEVSARTWATVVDEEA